MRKRTWKKKDNLIKIAIIMFAVSLLLTTGYGLFHDEIKITGTISTRRADPGHDPEEIISGAELKEKMSALVGTMGYQNITGFVHSSSPPSYDIMNNPANIISGPYSTYPTYIWLSGHLICWWSQGSPKMPQDASSMFEGCSNLTNIRGLADFDWSTCHNASKMFSGCTNLSNLSFIRNVDVSNITDMSEMFKESNNLRSINYLASWDVSKVENFSRMFFDCPNLYDVSGINGWNIKSDANFYQMFGGTNGTSPSKPSFTNVPGSFDGEGTFIPSRGRSVIQENVIDEEITNTIDDSNIIESSNIVEENVVESENIETNNTIEQSIVNEIEESEKNFEEKNNGIEDLTNVEDKVDETNEKDENVDDKSVSESN